jgi:hypothetical protein
MSSRGEGNSGNLAQHTSTRYHNTGTRRGGDFIMYKVVWASDDMIIFDVETREEEFCRTMQKLITLRSAWLSGSHSGRSTLTSSQD